jgi:hypothetical protein
MNFDERLAAAAAKPRPHRDVTVILDQEAAAERDAILERLAATEKTDAEDKRLAAPALDMEAVQRALDAVEESARDSMVTLRFVRLPGDLWADLIWKYPPKEAELDKFYGYDVNGVVRAVTGLVAEDGERFAFRVEDGENVPLAPEKWAVLFRTITGTEAASIRDAVFALNEWEPQQRIETALKSYGVATRSEKK